MNIKESKAQRDALWAELSSHLESNAKVYDKEREIRGKIATLQKDLYQAEMEPVYHTLKKDLSAGKYDNSSDKKTVMESKLALLETKFG